MVRWYSYWYSPAMNAISDIPPRVTRVQKKRYTVKVVVGDSERVRQLRADWPDIKFMCFDTEVGNPDDMPSV